MIVGILLMASGHVEQKPSRHKTCKTLYNILQPPTVPVWRLLLPSFVQLLPWHPCCQCHVQCLGEGAASCPSTCKNWVDQDLPSKVWRFWGKVYHKFQIIHHSKSTISYKRYKVQIVSNSFQTQRLSRLSLASSFLIISWYLDVSAVPGCTGKDLFEIFECLICRTLGSWQGSSRQMCLVRKPQRYSKIFKDCR